MANLALLHSPPSDGGTYSGNGWQSTLPLANLTTQPPRQVARSTAKNAAFVVDLGAAQPISTFAFIATNLTATALMRLRVSANADGSSPVLDTARACLRAGYDARAEPQKALAFYQHPTVVSGRYLYVDLNDDNNPAGYLQIGRFMAGVPFQPRVNISYGAGVGLIDESRLSRTVGGQTWADRVPQRRRLTAAFGALSAAEAYDAAWMVMRRVGVGGNLLAVYDPADADLLLPRRALYGTLPSLADLVTANASIDAPYTWSLAVEELL